VARWPGLIYVSFNLSAEAPFNIACNFNRAWRRLRPCTQKAALTYGIREGACSMKNADMHNLSHKKKKRDMARNRAKGLGRYKRQIFAPQLVECMSNGIRVLEKKLKNTELTALAAEICTKWTLR